MTRNFIEARFGFPFGNNARVAMVVSEEKWPFPRFTGLRRLKFNSA
jgi:hypothetical protein